MGTNQPMVLMVTNQLGYDGGKGKQLTNGTNVHRKERKQLEKQLELVEMNGGNEAVSPAVLTVGTN